MGGGKSLGGLSANRNAAIGCLGVVRLAMRLGGAVRDWRNCNRVIV